MMLKKCLFLGLACFGVTFLAACNSNESSQEFQNHFACGRLDGVPTTVFNSSRGAVKVISWKLDYFNGSGYTPERRCAEVTARFQNFYVEDKEKLNFLSTGKKLGYPIICVSPNDSCLEDGLLFTLPKHKTDRESREIVYDLMDIRNRAGDPVINGVEPIVETNGNKVTINFWQFVQAASVVNLDK